MKYCATNDCEEADCHRCYPQHGCEFHEKCKEFTLQNGVKKLYEMTTEEALSLAKQLLELTGEEISVEAISDRMATPLQEFQKAAQALGRLQETLYGGR